MRCLIEWPFEVDFNVGLAIASKAPFNSRPVSEASDPRRLVDKLLRGAKPADVPVEAASLLELVVNQKSARALGITIPRSLLLQADRVIE